MQTRSQRMLTPSTSFIDEPPPPPPPTTFFPSTHPLHIDGIFVHQHAVTDGGGDTSPSQSASGGVGGGYFGGRDTRTTSTEDVSVPGSETDEDDIVDGTLFERSQAPTNAPSASAAAPRRDSHHGGNPMHRRRSVSHAVDDQILEFLTATESVCSMLMRVLTSRASSSAASAAVTSKPPAGPPPSASELATAQPSPAAVSELTRQLQAVVKESRTATRIVLTDQRVSAIQNRPRGAFPISWCGPVASILATMAQCVETYRSTFVTAYKGGGIYAPADLMDDPQQPPRSSRESSPDPSSNKAAAVAAVGGPTNNGVEVYLASDDVVVLNLPPQAAVVSTVTTTTTASGNTGAIPHHYHHHQQQPQQPNRSPPRSGEIHAAASGGPTSRVMPLALAGSATGSSASSGLGGSKSTTSSTTGQHGWRGSSAPTPMTTTPSVGAVSVTSPTPSMRFGLASVLSPAGVAAPLPSPYASMHRVGSSASLPSSNLYAFDLTSTGSAAMRLHGQNPMASVLPRSHPAGAAAQVAEDDRTSAVMPLIQLFGQMSSSSFASQRQQPQQLPYQHYQPPPLAQFAGGEGQTSVYSFGPHAHLMQSHNTTASSFHTHWSSQALTPMAANGANTSGAVRKRSLGWSFAHFGAGRYSSEVFDRSGTTPAGAAAGGQQTPSAAASLAALCHDPDIPNGVLRYGVEECIGLQRYILISRLDTGAASRPTPQQLNSGAMDHHHHQQQQYTNGGWVRMGLHVERCLPVAIRKLQLADDVAAALQPNHNNLSTMMEKLQREIAVMKQLQHKNLARVHEVILDASRKALYVVMQYADRCSVARLASSNTTTASISNPATTTSNAPPSKVKLSTPPLDLLAVLSVGRQAAAALEYLHRNGVAHREVQPENLLWTSDGRVMLGDVRLMSIAPTSTATATTTTTAGAATSAMHVFVDGLLLPPESIRLWRQVIAKKLFGVAQPSLTPLSPLSPAVVKPKPPTDSHRSDVMSLLQVSTTSRDGGEGQLGFSIVEPLGSPSHAQQRPSAAPAAPAAPASLHMSTNTVMSIQQPAEQPPEEPAQNVRWIEAGALMAVMDEASPFSVDHFVMESSSSQVVVAGGAGGAGGGGGLIADETTSTSSLASAASVAAHRAHKHASPKALAAASDVWALGVTLFALAVGHLPFATTTEIANLSQGQVEAMIRSSVTRSADNNSDAITIADTMGYQELQAVLLQLMNVDVFCRPDAGWAKQTLKAIEKRVRHRMATATAAAAMQPQPALISVVGASTTMCNSDSAPLPFVSRGAGSAAAFAMRGGNNISNSSASTAAPLSSEMEEESSCEDSSLLPLGTGGPLPIQTAAVDPQASSVKSCPTKSLFSTETSEILALASSGRTVLPISDSDLRGAIVVAPSPVVAPPAAVFVSTANGRQAAANAMTR